MVAGDLLTAIKHLVMFDCCDLVASATNRLWLALNVHELLFIFFQGAIYATIYKVIFVMTQIPLLFTKVEKHQRGSNKTKRNNRLR